MKKLLKKESGITVIALVITIMIIVLLTTVSIKLGIGQNGVVEQAGNAKNTHEVVSEREAIQRAYNVFVMDDETGENNGDVLQVSGAEVTGNSLSGWKIFFPDTGDSYKLFADGEIMDPSNYEEWDKNAASEDCFLWESDDPNSPEYGVVIGYKSKANNHTKLRYPSRTTEIGVGKNPNAAQLNDIRTFTSNIERVEIPNTVTKIGNSAFGVNFSRAFKNLKEVVMSDNITSIGVSAFSGCDKLKYIDIPSGVTSIGTCAFQNCSSLTSIVIPNGIDTISSNTFDGCKNLNNITIPNNVKVIGSAAFQDCTNLSNIQFHNGIIDVGGLALTRTAWFNNQPDGPIYIGTCFYKYKGDMPANTNFVLKNDTTSISGWAFVFVENRWGYTGQDRFPGRG